MKKILILLALVVATGSVYSQEKKDLKGLARVQKVRGYEVYVMCEPLREYEIIEEVTSQFTASTSMPMPNIVEVYVDKAQKKLKRKETDKELFDALIINSAKALIIKWKDE